MKKIFVLILSFFVFGVADIKEQVSSMMSEKTKRNIKVIKILDLKSSKDVKLAILEDVEAKAQVPVFVSADGKMVMGLSNIYIPKDDEDILKVSEAYKQTNLTANVPKPEELNKFFSSIKQNRFVSLKGKKSSTTTYLVVDPRCPGCRKEIGHLEEKLKVGDVKLLFVGFLGKESLVRSSLIKEKLVGVNDNTAKIKIIREIFNPDFNVGDSSIDTKAIELNTKEVSEVGISSVPFEHKIQK